MIEPTNYTLPAYYRLLLAHDWYFEYSDDQGVWKRGCQNLSKLETISKTSYEHQELFNAFRAAHFVEAAPAMPDSYDEWKQETSGNE